MWIDSQTPTANNYLLVVITTGFRNVLPATSTKYVVTIVGTIAAHRRDRVVIEVGYNSQHRQNTGPVEIWRSLRPNMGFTVFAFTNDITAATTRIAPTAVNRKAKMNCGTSLSEVAVADFIVKSEVRLDL